MYVVGVIRVGVIHELPLYIIKIKYTTQQINN